MSILTEKVGAAQATGWQRSVAPSTACCVVRTGVHLPSGPTSEKTAATAIMLLPFR